MKKISLIGLDGMSWKFLNAIFEFGAMPHLRKLCSNGVRGILKSTIPPYTPPAWTSIFTGVNPGKHGVYGFHDVRRISKGFKFSLASSLSVKYPRVFEMLSMHGLNSIVINVPLTYPLQAISPKKYIVVTDWAAPKIKAYPENILSKYKELMRRPPHIWFSSKISDDEYVNMLVENLQLEGNALYDLIKNFDWDLFIIVFSELDWIQHRFPELQFGRGLNKVARIFNIIDEYIKKLHENSEVIFVVSDHGFKFYKYVVQVNAVLRDYGLLTVTNKPKITPFVEETRLHLLPKPLQNKIVKYGLRILRKLLSKEITVDYARSKAFMIENGSWGIYCVSKNACEEVYKILSKIPYIKRIYYSQDIYWGPYVSYAPDLICVPREDSWCSNEINELISYNHVDHHKDGIFIAYGDDLLKNVGIGNISVYDIVPTILTCLGLPLPHDTDGKSLNVFYDQSPTLIKRMNYSEKYRIFRIKLHS